MRVRAYLGIARINLIRLNQYRISAINNVVSVLFYGFIQTSILLAFFRFARVTDVGVTVAQAVTYAWLTQAFHSIHPIFEDGDLTRQITDGTFVYDLCRPLDLYAHWFFRSLAHKVAPLALYIPFVIGPALLFPHPYRMLPPAGVLALLGFVAALVAAILMATAITTILTALRVRVEQGAGLIGLIAFVIGLLSGGEVPLPILPAEMVRVLRILPFAGLFDIPCSTYLGLIPVDRTSLFVLRQLGWTVVFIATGALLLRRGVRRAVIQGG